MENRVLCGLKIRTYSHLRLASRGRYLAESFCTLPVLFHRCPLPPHFFLATPRVAWKGWHKDFEGDIKRGWHKVFNFLEGGIKRVGIKNWKAIKKLCLQCRYTTRISSFSLKHRNIQGGIKKGGINFSKLRGGIKRGGITIWGVA